MNPNQPKSLTTEQRLFVDQLVTHFGEKHVNVKRSDLLKASKEISGNAYPPAWISRNLKVRSKEKRGRYDLSVLLKLPVVAFKEETPKKKAKKVKVVETVPVEAPVENLDGIPLLPPTTKTRKKKVIKTEAALEMVTPAQADGEVE